MAREILWIVTMVAAFAVGIWKSWFSGYTIMWMAILAVFVIWTVGHYFISERYFGRDAVSADCRDTSLRYRLTSLLEMTFSNCSIGSFYSSNWYRSAGGTKVSDYSFDFPDSERPGSKITVNVLDDSILQLSINWGKDAPYGNWYTSAKREFVESVLENTFFDLNKSKLAAYLTREAQASNVHRLGPPPREALTVKRLGGYNVQAGAFA